MAEHDRSYMTSYQSDVVSIAQSCATFESVHVEECHDRES